MFERHRRRRNFTYSRIHTSGCLAKIGCHSVWWVSRVWVCRVNGCLNAWTSVCVCVSFVQQRQILSSLSIHSNRNKSTVLFGSPSSRCRSIERNQFHFYFTILLSFGYRQQPLQTTDKSTLKPCWHLPRREWERENGINPVGSYFLW